MMKKLISCVGIFAIHVAAFTLISSMIGCSARQVYRDGDIGVVAIPANTNAWPSRYRQRAETLMADHFPGGYEIIKEEETVVGQTTRYRENQESEDTQKTDRVNVASAQTSGSITTRDDTEYRIHYRRR